MSLLINFTQEIPDFVHQMHHFIKALSSLDISRIRVYCLIKHSTIGADGSSSSLVWVQSPTCTRRSHLDSLQRCGNVLSLLGCWKAVTKPPLYSFSGPAHPAPTTLSQREGMFKSLAAPTLWVTASFSVSIPPYIFKANHLSTTQAGWTLWLGGGGGASLSLSHSLVEIILSQNLTID